MLGRFSVSDLSKDTQLNQGSCGGSTAPRGRKVRLLVPSVRHRARPRLLERTRRGVGVGCVRRERANTSLDEEHQERRLLGDLVATTMQARCGRKPPAGCHRSELLQRHGQPRRRGNHHYDCPSWTATRTYASWLCISTLAASSLHRTQSESGSAATSLRASKAQIQRSPLPRHAGRGASVVLKLLQAVGSCRSRLVSRMVRN